MRRRCLRATARGALTLALLLGGIALLPTGKATAGTEGKRVCGILPGEGYYSFYKTKNVSCRIAKKVSRRAGENFCGQGYQHCNATPTGEPDKGRTTAKGWRCKMKVGYEFYKARCKRGDAKFVHESAA